MAVVKEKVSVDLNVTNLRLTPLCGLNLRLLLAKYLTSNQCAFSSYLRAVGEMDRDHFAKQSLGASLNTAVKEVS
jgi:hypothetical protein